MPNYLCDSVTRTIKEAGWKHKFYRINENLKFSLKEILSYENVDAVLVINYFGLVKIDREIIEIKKSRPNLLVIEDDVQAFFEYNNTKADYSFTSLRKCFPCPDGALISTNREMKPYIAEHSKWNQYKFAGNILKNYSKEIGDDICLELLGKGEELLDVEYHSVCSNVSHIIYSNIDFDFVIEKRKQNAKFLHENLLSLGVRHIYNKDSVPLFVPVFINNRDVLRKLFFSNRIYTPIHWPNVSYELNGNSKIYSLELSLICDQRYNLGDMRRQIAVLEQFLDGEDMYFENNNN